MKKILILILALVMSLGTVSNVYAIEINDKDMYNDDIVYLNGRGYDLSTLEGSSDYFRATNYGGVDFSKTDISKIDSNYSLPSNVVKNNADMLLESRSFSYYPSFFPLDRMVKENAQIIESLYDTLYQQSKQLTGNPITAAAVAYGASAGYFAGKVKIGGDWDLKSTYNLSWEDQYLTFIGGKFVYLYGDDIGNIHYGYVGKTIFPKFVLRSAGGLIQIVGGEYKLEWFSTYFDDPEDRAAIDRGIEYYDSGTFE